MKKKIWYKNSEPPTKDKSGCLINFGGNNYRDFEIVLWDAKDQCFITALHPYCTMVDDEEIRLDRILLKEIKKWAYLEDLLKQ